MIAKGDIGVIFPVEIVDRAISENKEGVADRIAVRYI